MPNRRVPPWIRERNRRWRLAALGIVASVLFIALMGIGITRYRTSHPGFAQGVATDLPSAHIKTSPASTVTAGAGESGSSEFPNARLTPGAIASSDTDTICRSGYATSVRPTGLLWRRLKDEAYARYGLARGQRSSISANGIRVPSYEVDHLVPLELGGDPTSLHNIWPEPLESAKRKDVVENELHELVCSGRMALAQAQGSIARDWKTAVPGRPTP